MFGKSWGSVMVTVNVNGTDIKFSIPSYLGVTLSCIVWMESTAASMHLAYVSP